MRITALHALSFGAGFALALAVALTRKGVRNARERREQVPDRRTVIDGARPADPVALASRPAPEPVVLPQLESESDDVSPVSQRW